MNRTQLARQGDPAAIRPVCPADLPALGEFFAGLSVQARYLRFFAPVTPTGSLLRLLAAEPAHVDAVIAVADGVIVGHAMAADRAEAAACRGARVTAIGLVVADAWQGRGVGSALMIALIARAQRRGVISLEMDVLQSNRKVLAMITGHWPSAVIDRTSDGLGIRVPLPAHQPQPPRTQPVPALAAVGG